MMSCNKVVIDYFVCVIVVSFDKRPEPQKIAELTIKEKWENKRIIPFKTPQAATFCFKIWRIDYDHLINLLLFRL